MTARSARGQPAGTSGGAGEPTDGRAFSRRVRVRSCAWRSRTWRDGNETGVVRTSDQQFVAEERIGWDTTEWYEIWEEAERLESYMYAVEALEADDRTKGQLGQMIGTRGSRSLLDPERLFLGELL